MVQTAQANLSRLIALLLTAACILAIGAAVLYIGTIAYGVAVGAALPAAAVFRIFTLSFALLELEPRLSVILISVALTGAAASWLGRIGILRSEPIDAAERWIEGALRGSGVVIIFLCLTLSINAGGWGGKVFVPSLSWPSLLNLVPLSDASDYMSNSWDRAVNDHWGMVAANRPLAQAMRDLTFLLSGYSYPNTLLLQTVLVTLAVALAAGRIALHKGIWSAIAFVGLVTAITRTLLPSVMTEPLALAPALVGIAFYFDAIRERSGRHAIVALAAITMALTIRMGSMFVIPFLVVSTAYVVGHDLVSRVRSGALLAFTCLAVLSAGALIGHLYSPSGGAIGGNFAVVLCGLSIGGSWADCLNLYANELSGLGQYSRSAVSIVLEKTASNIIAAPVMFLKSLGSNVASYLVDLPQHWFPGLKSGWPLIICTASRFLRRASRDISLESRLRGGRVLVWPVSVRVRLCGVCLWRRQPARHGGGKRNACGADFVRVCDQKQCHAHGTRA